MIKISKEEIKALHSSRVVSFRYDLLDRYDHKVGEIEGKGGNVKFNSLAEIKRTGKFNFKATDLDNVDWITAKIQPFMIINNKYHYSLGVFHISSPEKKLINGEIFRSVEAYDNNIVLVEDKIDKRTIIPKGSNYVTTVKQIINGAGLLKLEIAHSDLKTSIDKEYEVGTSKLDIINDLLAEVNYNSLWMDNMGFARSEPYLIPTERTIEYDYRNNDISVIIKNSSSEELDSFSVPNKFILTATNPEREVLLAKFTNDNPISPLSTVNRGRNIVLFQKIDDIADQVTLNARVRRLAYEKSNVYGKFIFNTALMPHHENSDCLYCEHTDLGIQGKYIEESWSMTLEHGGIMNHICKEVINI